MLKSLLCVILAASALYGQGAVFPPPSGGGGGGSGNILSINGDTTAAQVIAAGSAGTDFAVAESGATHTFNLPTADGTHTGKLAAADWTTFNGKQAALGFTPDHVVTATAPLVRTANDIACNVATGSVAGCLAAADWTTFNAKAPTASPTFSGTVTVGTSLSVDGTTGIATSSKLGNAAFSLLTGAGKFSSGVPVGQAACADLSNASAACSSLTSLSLITPNIGAATGTSLAVTGALTSGSGSGVGGALDLTQGTLPAIIANTISHVAPTSVTGYEIVYASAAATGIPHRSNSANVVTESVGLIVNADITNTTIDLTSKVTGVLPNANTTAASANTNSAIVTRDGSGNFAAGTITAALTGTASGNCAAGADCSFTNLQTVTLNTLNTTSTDAIVLANNTASGVSQQQISPRIRMRANGWGTSGGANQTGDLLLENYALKDSTVANNLRVSYQEAGGTLTPMMQLTPLVAAHSYSAMYGNVTPSATNYNFYWANDNSDTGVNGTQVNLKVAGSAKLSIAATSIQMTSSGTYLIFNPGGTANALFGTSSDHNYKLDVGKSGSTGSLLVKDQTASTGFTRVLFDLGAADSATTVTFTNNGTTKSAGYQSSDGSVGVTGATCTSWKNGLCTSL